MIVDPPRADLWRVGETVRLAEFTGTVVRRWTYSLQIRTPSGLVSGMTSLIPAEDVQGKLADLALE